MNEVRLIDAEALKKAIISICGNCSNIIREYKEGVPDGNCAIQHIMNIIDNAPTVNEVRVIDTNAENNSENALLKDIAHSLAIIADNSTKNGNTQESGNEMLRWVHSEAHRVMCPKCGCRVSINAAYEMDYCFKCGAKLGGIKNE